MFGSLDEFIEVPEGGLITNIKAEHSHTVESLKQRRGVYTPSYAVQNKNFLLSRSLNNQGGQTADHNILKRPQTHSSYQKYSSQETQVRLLLARPPPKDYISKKQLKRKHDLLRAIVRTKNSEEEKKGATAYEQSFKRLYTGLIEVQGKPQIDLTPLFEDEGQELRMPGSIGLLQKPKKNLSKQKRVEFQKCLSWAKKRKKNGTYYCKQLGKTETNDFTTGHKRRARTIINHIARSISQIGKTMSVPRPQEYTM